MPSTPLRFEDSKKSAGLTLADIYLWLYKRHFDGKPLAPELEYIVYSNAQRGRTDEISLNAIGSRWSKWFAELPEPSPEAVAKAVEIRRKEEERRLEAVRSLS
jgi:hypothetical protein